MPPCRNQGLGLVLGQAGDEMHAETNRTRSTAGRFERAISFAGVDIGVTNLDVMLAGVAHELSRRIEAHELAVQERGAKSIRVVPHSRRLFDSANVGFWLITDEDACRSNNPDEIALPLRLMHQ